MHTDTITALIDSRVSRRAFARTAFAGGLIAAVQPALGPAAQAQSAGELSDEDILNFALLVEYVDTEYFTVATTGQRLEDIGIPIDGVGRVGPTVGGRAIALDGFARVLAEHLTLDEQGHVMMLRAALGSAAIAKPTINLEALGMGFGGTNEFLTMARAFEDVGTSAYAGGAPQLRDPGHIATTARIALAEAQHVGAVRWAVANANVAVPQLDQLDVPPLGSPGGRLFSVFDQGLSVVRTPQQVLAILFGNAAPGTDRGGFLPDGANGAIRTV
jgi:hypothetical protein